MFDVNSFLDTQITEANSTESIPVPAGEYIAVIESVKARQWTSKEDPTKAGVALDVSWLIDDQGVKELLGRDKIISRQGIMLDLTEDGKGLDFSKGRNVGLGRLRAAVDLNQSGQPFSFHMLPGRTAKVSVTHRPSPDGTQIYAEVKAVAHL